MTIEDKPIVIGEGIFLKVQTLSGKWQYKPSTVLEIIERPAAVKVRYSHGAGFKRAWFPAAQFTFKPPTPEEQKAANTKTAEGQPA